MEKETNDKILKRIAKNIERERTAMGTPSIEKLSKKTNLSFQTLLNLKNNRSDSVSLSTLVEIANVLNCKVIDLVK